MEALLGSVAGKPWAAGAENILEVEAWDQRPRGWGRQAGTQAVQSGHPAQGLLPAVEFFRVFLSLITWNLCAMEAS